MKLKVCGMTFSDNIEQVAALQPDYLGFIFYEKSPRFFNSIIPTLPNQIKKVGVFVNKDPKDILAILQKHELDVIQLHGNQTKTFIQELTGLLKVNKKTVELWKVFSIDKHFNFNKIEPFSNLVDKFLFDTKGKLKGGNGYAFNWKLLNAYPSTKPFVLSGGIGLETANDIKDFFKQDVSKYCYAIDVNSKFEIEPGLKDITSLKTFQQIVVKLENNKQDKSRNTNEI